MSLEPERLVEILKGESLPPGWFAAVSDRKNISMARTHMAEQFLGQPASEASLSQYGDAPRASSRPPMWRASDRGTPSISRS